jgi:hypothetical protein
MQLPRLQSQIDNGVAAQRAKGLQTSISEPCALAAANRRWLWCNRLGRAQNRGHYVIELVRGVPMLVARYVSSFIVPMMIPGVQVNLFVSVIASGFTVPYGRSRFALYPRPSARERRRHFGDSRAFEVRRDCQKTIFALQRRGHQLALPVGHF